MPSTYLQTSRRSVQSWRCPSSRTFQPYRSAGGVGGDSTSFFVPSRSRVVAPAPKLQKLLGIGSANFESLQHARRAERRGRAARAEAEESARVLAAACPTGIEAGQVTASRRRRRLRGTAQLVVEAYRARGSWPRSRRPAGIKPALTRRGSARATVLLSSTGDLDHVRTSSCGREVAVRAAWRVACRPPVVAEAMGVSPDVRWHAPGVVGADDVAASALTDRR